MYEKRNLHGVKVDGIVLRMCTGPKISAMQSNLMSCMDADYVEQSGKKTWQVATVE